MIPESYWIEEFPPKSKDWLIEGLVSPYINILSGQPKVGKSTLATAIALSIINNEEFLNMPVSRSGAVAWLGYDSGWEEELRSRALLRAKNRILMQKSFDLTDLDSARILGEKLRGSKCELLIIDHLYGFANSRNLEINNQLDATIALRGVNLINSEYGIPIILIAQATKGRSGSVAHSNYIKGLARVLLEVTGTSANGKRSLRIVGNEVSTTKIDFMISGRSQILPVEFKQQDSRQNRNFVAINQAAKTALSSAASEDLRSASAFGRLLYRLKYSDTEGGGIKMAQRLIKMGMIEKSEGSIKKGPNFAP